MSRSRVDDGMPRTVIWAGEAPEANEFFWHQTASAARAIRVVPTSPSLVGLSVEWPAALRVRTMLPRPVMLGDLSAAIQHLRDLCTLARAPVVLVCGNAGWIADAILEAVAVDAISPSDQRPAPSGFMRLDGKPVLFVRPGVEAAARVWRLGFDAAAQARAERRVGHYAASALCSPAGHWPLEAGGPLPVRRVAGRARVTLLPGHGGGDTRLRLLTPPDAPADPAAWRLGVDGRSGDLVAVDGGLETVVPALAAAAWHRLELRRLAGAATIALYAIRLERLT
jgi:hypothetical protein